MERDYTPSPRLQRSIDMLIRTEYTPNPQALKFLTNYDISAAPVFFTQDTGAPNSALARKLLGIAGVISVFFGSNFITITKDIESEWENIKHEVIITIVEHFDSGLTSFDQQPSADVHSPSSEIEQQIIDILDLKIRPAVAMDGGDIVFISFADGVVKLELRGACVGCPSSLDTLKRGVESTLQYYIPQVLSVEAVNL